MQNKNFFGIDFNWKSITLLAFLAIFPNLLGMINFNIAGLKVHLFQYLIFIAAAIYGPAGGLISGGFGSLFTAATMNNPYIILGNMVLGFMTGFLFRKGLNLILAAIIAYSVQLPWLYLTDIYLAGMPVKLIQGIIIALLISNLVWATIANLTKKHIKKAITWTN